MSLDSNPIAEADKYRDTIVESFPSLKVLDQIKLTEEEKVAATLSAKIKNEKKWESQRADEQEKERDVAILAVKNMWTRRRSVSSALSPWDTRTSPRRRSSSNQTMADITAGFSEVEVVPDESYTLYIYGNAMEVLRNEDIKSMATRIVLRYVPISKVTEVLSSDKINFFSEFPNLCEVTLSDNNLNRLEEIFWVQQLPSRCTSVRPISYFL